jgi:glycosyltransferase involved in cell wall biosynthesis
MRPSLLCIAQSFSPQTTPTAIRAGKLLARLSERWEITVLTEAHQHGAESAVRPLVVNARRPRRLFALLRRARLNKLVELLVWPDESIFWVIPAVLAGRRLIRERRPQAIVVFMMPYSAGLAGVLLAKLSGLPLILNLDDSLTCTDMHPRYPTRLHYRLARALEDLYARQGDAVVYVSQTNLEAVRDRQRADVAEKLALVRYGADPADFRPRASRSEDFEIAYVGAMSGWWALIGAGARAGPVKRMYAWWTRLGRYERTVLDDRTSSPAFLGRAILDVLAEHPQWDGKMRLVVYGNPYDGAVVARALARAGVERVVSVRDPVPHARVADIVCGADLLFIALPKRTDGTPGGRISAKTYEYLMTDRPILAAVPHGESWSYLADKPGVWLVEPDDRVAMRAVVDQLAAAKLAGSPRAFDRERLRSELSYEKRAREFERVIEAAVERRRRRASHP